MHGSNMYDKIKKIRMGKGMTQADVAKKIGKYDGWVISKYETGRRVPTLESMRLLAEALDVSVLEFVCIDGLTDKDVEFFINQMRDRGKAVTLSDIDWIGEGRELPWQCQTTKR